MAETAKLRFDELPLIFSIEYRYSKEQGKIIAVVKYEDGGGQQGISVAISKSPSCSDHVKDTLKDAAVVLIDYTDRMISCPSQIDNVWYNGIKSKVEQLCLLES